MATSLVSVVISQADARNPVYISCLFIGQTESRSFTNCFRVLSHFRGHFIQRIIQLNPENSKSLRLIKSSNYSEVDIRKYTPGETLLLCPYSTQTKNPLNHQESMNVRIHGELFDLILYVSSTIFQLNRDGYSWVETVLN